MDRVKVNMDRVKVKYGQSKGSIWCMYCYLFLFNPTREIQKEIQLNQELTDIEKFIIRTQKKSEKKNVCTERE